MDDGTPGVGVYAQVWASAREYTLSADLTDARAGDPFKAASPCLDLSPMQVRVLPGAR